MPFPWELNYSPLPNESRKPWERDYSPSPSPAESPLDWSKRQLSELESTPYIGKLASGVLAIPGFRSGVETMGAGVREFSSQPWKGAKDVIGGAMEASTVPGLAAATLGIGGAAMAGGLPAAGQAALHLGKGLAGATALKYGGEAALSPFIGEDPASVVSDIASMVPLGWYGNKLRTGISKLRTAPPAQDVTVTPPTSPTATPEGGVETFKPSPPITGEQMEIVPQKDLVREGILSPREEVNVPPTGATDIPTGRRKYRPTSQAEEELKKIQFELELQRRSLPVMKAAARQQLATDKVQAGQQMEFPLVEPNEIIEPNKLRGPIPAQPTEKLSPELFESAAAEAPSTTPSPMEKAEILSKSKTNFPLETTTGEQGTLWSNAELDPFKGNAPEVVKQKRSAIASLIKRQRQLSNEVNKRATLEGEQQPLLTPEGLTPLSETIPGTQESLHLTYAKQLSEFKKSPTYEKLDLASKSTIDKIFTEAISSLSKEEKSQFFNWKSSGNAAPSPPNPLRVTVTPRKDGTLAPFDTPNDSPKDLAEMSGNTLRNLSGLQWRLGRARDNVKENFSLYRMIDPRGALEWMRFAGARTKAGLIRQTYIPDLERVAGSKDNYLSFIKALIHDRLIGIKRRAQFIGDRFVEGTDEEVLKGARGQIREHMLNSFDNPDAAEAMKNKIQSLIDQGPEGLPELRRYMSGFWYNIASKQNLPYTPQEYLAITSDPRFQMFEKRYGETIEAALAQSHASNEGVFTDALGPRGKYYPLIPEETSSLDKPKVWWKPLDWDAPENPNNKFATGLAEKYDSSVDALIKSYARTLTKNGRAAAIKATVESKVGSVVGRNALPSQMEVAGKVFNAGEGGWISSKGALYSPSGELVAHPVTPVNEPQNSYKYLVLPRAISDEVAPLLENSPIPPGAWQKAADKLIRIQLWGVMEAGFHGWNLANELVTRTPFVASKISTYPLFRKFAIYHHLLKTNATSPESMEILNKLADLGLLSAHSGDISTSKTLSKLFNIPFAGENVAGPWSAIKSVPNFSRAFLYGPNGMERRTKLLAYKMFTDAYPEVKISTPEGAQALTKFMTAFITYNKLYASAIERGLKKNSLGRLTAPFISASSRMFWNGTEYALNAIDVMSKGKTHFSPTPRTGKELTDISRLVGQHILLGISGAVASWMLGHRALTGKWPTEDNEARFMEYPIPDDIRSSAVGKLYWGDNPGKAYVKMGAFFAPSMLRGIFYLPLSNAYSESKRGGSSVQVLSEAGRGATNVLLHPFSTGTLPTAAAHFFGYEPYIQSFYDPQGNWAVTPRRASPPADSPSKLLASRGASVLRGLNPLAPIATSTLLRGTESESPIPKALGAAAIGAAVGGLVGKTPGMIGGAALGALMDRMVTPEQAQQAMRWISPPEQGSDRGDESFKTAISFGLGPILSTSRDYASERNRALRQKKALQHRSINWESKMGGYETAPFGIEGL